MLKVEDEISLDAVIAKVKAAANEDTCGEEFLAAAITLRDASGRDRKTALRKMANAWGVTVNEKVEGKYKPRPNSALAEDIQAAVCKAALDWESRAQPSQGSDKRAPSRPDAEVVLTKARTTGAAEDGAAVATHAGSIVHQLPETPDDVLARSRVQPSMDQGTLRSEHVAQAKAKAKAECPTFGKKDAEHASIGARVSSLCFRARFDIGGR